ncbi:hypothetical protein [Crossiella cryophila]|uniref:Uncharacterized protein n=1 Tax=Crossiella cryophila TaxID=43355 RepID=A0A7W7FTQ5_9PSEU|nr:hypothetical protein [Crossiella cryophila]MBB4677240.1 hypothetical protein [Crossiella cryophila]
MAARSSAARLTPLLADSLRGQEARRAQLAGTLAGFQAETDLLQRAGVLGPADSLASQQVRRQHAAPTDQIGRLPSLPDLPMPKLPTGRGSRLATNLLAMPNLAELSGGRAINPVGFVTGRAAAVDECRNAITERVQDAVHSRGKPGAGGQCLGSPVGAAYRESTPLDPAGYRSRLDQLAAGPPQALLDRHRDGQEKAKQPPQPPSLPKELTESNSSCRSLDNAMDYVPLVGNLVEHLCLLALE